MSVSNLHVPNEDPIYSGSVSTDKFLFKGKILETNAKPAILLPEYTINGLIACTNSGVTTQNLELPSAAQIFDLLPNAEIGSTFMLNVVNYNADGQVVMLPSPDGTFSLIHPTIGCSNTNNSAQISRVFYAVVQSLDASTAGAIILY